MKNYENLSAKSIFEKHYNEKHLLIIIAVLFDKIGKEERKIK